MVAPIIPEVVINELAATRAFASTSAGMRASRAGRKKQAMANRRKTSR